MIKRDRWPDKLCHCLDGPFLGHTRRRADGQAEPWHQFCIETGHLQIKKEASLDKDNTIRHPESSDIRKEAFTIFIRQFERKQEGAAHGV